MKIYKFSILVLLFTVMTFPAVNVSVTSFSYQGIQPAIAEAITELFSVHLSRIPEYKLLDRQNLARLLEEQAFQNSGCTDQSCAVEIGRLLNMEYMFIGTVLQIGEKVIITVKKVSVDTGEVIYSDKTPSFILSSVEEEVEDLAAKFAREVKGTTEPKVISEHVKTEPARKKRVKAEKKVERERVQKGSEFRRSVIIGSVMSVASLGGIIGGGTTREKGDTFPFMRTLRSVSLLGPANSDIGGVRDESSLELNPAGLARLEHTSVNLGARNWIAGTYLVSGNYSMRLPVEAEMGLALGVDFLGFGRDAAVLTDGSGNNIGEMSLGELMINAGYGITLPFGLAVGTSLHFFNGKRGVTDADQRGVVLALGLQYPLVLPNSTIAFGFNTRNALGDTYSGVYMAGISIHGNKGFSLMTAFEPSSAGYFMFDIGIMYTARRDQVSIIPSLSLRQGTSDADGGSINLGMTLVVRSIKFHMGGAYAHNIKKGIFGGGITYFIKKAPLSTATEVEDHDDDE